MKTMTTIKHAMLLAMLGAVLAVPALAQSGPGAQSAAPCAANATNCGPGMMGGPGSGRGMGPGMNQGMGPGGRQAMRFSQKNTAGWGLMTPEERTAHREKMFATKSYDECKVVQADHHKQMEVRAKEKGVTLPEPRANGCDRMKARGIVK